MPMISAMIVMTTSSSTSVKPRSPRGAGRRLASRRLAKVRMPTLSADDLADGKKRRHHRYDQPADDDRDGDDRGRPDDAHHAIEAALKLGFVELRDPSGEHRQLSRFLAQA